uniref:Uncharacterized protein n=1 Tax=Trypanosoma congolense (strain IL3000) TaxID=1068625 RepID=G0UUC7_TRYCI|nr:hypothetical protein TCIL3000_9_3910 [Trypanosoma congolense IL3000]
MGIRVMQYDGQKRDTSTQGLLLSVADSNTPSIQNSHQGKRAKRCSRPALGVVVRVVKPNPRCRYNMEFGRNCSFIWGIFHQHQTTAPPHNTNRTLLGKIRDQQGKAVRRWKQVGTQRKKECRALLWLVATIWPHPEGNKQHKIYYTVCSSFSNE